MRFSDQYNLRAVKYHFRRQDNVAEMGNSFKQSPRYSPMYTTVKVNFFYPDKSFESNIAWSNG